MRTWDREESAAFLAADPRPHHAAIDRASLGEEAMATMFARDAEIVLGIPTRCAKSTRHDARRSTRKSSPF